MLSRIFHVLAGACFSAVLVFPAYAEQVNSEVFAELDQAVATMTYTENGRFIFAYHPFYDPKIKMAERLESGEIIPFPNAEMQESHDRKGNLKNPGDYFNWVLTARADGEGTVWVLDSGQAEPRITPKLVAWDINNNRMKKVIYFPEGVTLPESQHNDFAISNKHNVVVIADEGIAIGPVGKKAALVVVNTETGQSRRLLQGTDSVLPDMEMPMVFDKGTKNERSSSLFIGVDGIALDKDEQWLYFTPANQPKVYRVLMRDLINTSLSEKQLVEKVEVYADKPVNGGLTIDAAGNLYLCAIGTRSIGVIPADTRKYTVYTTDERMIWPDAVNSGPDGYLYTGAAQVSLSAAMNNGKGLNKPPYLIFRFKPLADTLVGR